VLLVARIRTGWNAGGRAGGVPAGSAGPVS
jgi:hypothetical protein